MEFLEYLDRIGQRRLERFKLFPPRPMDTRMLVGTLFFLGYYILVFTMLKIVIPTENVPLVRDSLLVLGPVVGAIGSALFRTDMKDEMATQNTGEAFRAQRTQAEATIAAAATFPTLNSTNDMNEAAERVADAATDAAVDEADNIRSENK